MKIYNRVVIDIKSGEVIEEDSYEYSGPIIALKGGGGGGGSSSGKSDYPTYMKDIHANLMVGGNSSSYSLPFSPSNSLMRLIDNAVGTSPYSGEVAYNPDFDISAFLAALSIFSDNVDGLDTTWGTYGASVKSSLDGIIDNSDIAASTVAKGAVLDDRLTTEVIPRFEAGMRDINAVVSSSFVIGKSILEGFNTREVADYDAKLRVAVFTKKMDMIVQGVDSEFKLIQAKFNYKQAVMTNTIEAYRMKVVMKGEELQKQLDIDDHDTRWGLDLFQNGANALGSIAGSAINTQKTTSGSASVLGGALSGAASGAMVGAQVGGGYGAAIGGVIGGIGGLLF